MNDPSHSSEMSLLESRGSVLPARAAGIGVPLRLAFMTFLILAVAIGGFGLGIALGVRGTDVAMLGLALLTFALGWIPLVADQARAPADRHVLLDFVSIVFMAHFVVPALVLYLPAIGPIDASSTANTNLLPDDIVTGQMMALLGLVSLYAGYALPLGRGIARAVPSRRVDWNLPTCLAVAVMFLIAGWSVTLLGLVGMIPAAAGTGVVGVIVTGRDYANVLLTYAYLRHSSNLAALLIAMNVPLAVIYGLLTSDKQDTLIGPALIVLTAMQLNKRIRARWIVAGVVALAMLYPASEFVRRGLLPHASTAELVFNPGYTLSAISKYVGSGDASEHLMVGLEATSHRLDGLGIASVIVRDTPSASPFQNGRTLGLFFVSFIPRALWADKPNIQIGQWITDVYGSGPHIDARTAPTPIGEFYLNFGIPGVILGLMLMGVVLRLAHEILARRRATAPTILALTVVVLILCLHFAGSVAGVYGQVVFTLVPIWLLHLGIRMFLPVTTYPADENERSGGASAGTGVQERA